MTEESSVARDRRDSEESSHFSQPFDNNRSNTQERVGRKSKKDNLKDKKKAKNHLKDDSNPINH